MGRAIGMAVNLLNPQRVVIGGGLSLAFVLYEQELKQTVNSHIYQAANPDLTIVPSTLGGLGGLCGAAATAVCGTYQRCGYKGKAV